jgi:hypothetical protein
LPPGVKPELLSQCAAELDDKHISTGPEEVFPWVPYGRCLAEIGPAAIPALLEALEDPRRFATAHLVLFMIVTDHHMTTHEAELLEGGTQAGLTMRWEGRAIYTGKAQFDPADIPRLTRRWYNELGREAITIPYWAAAAAFGSAPALALLSVLLRQTRARARRLRGCCPTCGYDLRGSANRCPECGEIKGNRESLVSTKSR